MLRLSCLCQQLLALLSLIYKFQLVLAQQTVTITNEPAYSSLKICGQGCFFDVYACPKDVIGVDLGCIACTGNVNSVYWAPESCYCRPDLQTVALSSLTSCIESACTGGQYTIDLSSASSLYTGYCTAAGYLQATSTASTRGGTASPQPSPVVAPTATSPTSEPTSTSGSGSGSANSNNGDSSSSSELSPGIDTGIAIASLVVAGLTLWVGWITYLRMKKS